MIKIDSTYFIDPEEPEDQFGGQGGSESSEPGMSRMDYDYENDYTAAVKLIGNLIEYGYDNDKVRVSDESLETFFRKYKNYF